MTGGILSQTGCGGSAVLKVLRLHLIVFAALAPGARVDVVPGLFDTGVDANGAVGGSITNYNPLVPFSITSGFLAGVNHLDFAINNFPSSGSNPTGLRVDGLSATATALVSVEGASARAFRMLAPRPAPARGRVHLAFDVPRPGFVRASIRDLAGRVVWRLADREFPAGRSELVWEGQSPRSGRAAPGVYFAEIEYEGTREARRVLWLE